MIDGIELIPLSMLPSKDNSGHVLHMLRSDSPYFSKFGEIYFSITPTGIIKAWKRHLLKNQYLTVVSGRVKFVIYDAREYSPTRGQTQEIIISPTPQEYKLLKIPKNLIYGFTTISEETSIIANLTDIPHDESQAQTIKIESGAIPYSWER